MNEKYDYIIVGAGLFGATFAYLAHVYGNKRCLVVDKRSHIGGNIYCEEIEGISVHKYGAHIFHTDDEFIWEFVNKLVPFNNYINSPVANYKGELYNLPFNMNTFYQMWGVKTPQEALEKINSQKYKGEITNLEEQAKSLVGDDIYEKLIKGYTEKQWGRECKDLPSSIIKRIPLRFTFNNNYFNDKYQGVCDYNELISKLLSYADVKLNCNFLDDREKLSELAENIVYTGKIDEYYNYCFGELEYRTVDFVTTVENTANYQGNAVINYTDRETPYTRIIEHKHFDTNSKLDLIGKTVISKEFPSEWNKTKESYYPIGDKKNLDLYAQYKELASKEKHTYFGGRLAEYKYYDMDDTISSAFALWCQISGCYLALP